MIQRKYVRESGRDYALRVLKERIIVLDLAPGSMVSENELAAEMGLSRTPVREALIELSKVQIVQIYPQKGSSIALIDYALVEEAQFVRQVLECAVTALACHMASPADLRKLEQNLKLQQFCLDNQDNDQLMALDNAFHSDLFRIARKPLGYTLMDNLQIHFDRVRRMALTTVKQSHVVEDHQAILAAIAQRDEETAREKMTQHLSRYRVDEGALRQRDPGYFAETQGS